MAACDKSGVARVEGWRPCAAARRGVDNIVGGLIFFFQAEDGIRDVAVTGVQTCALPICARRTQWALRARRAAAWLALLWPAVSPVAQAGDERFDLVIVHGRIIDGTG